MSRKQLWIGVGVVVVAIFALAYVSYYPPSSKDTAGTIVEAKRAQADGANSFNPSPSASTTDDHAASSADDRASQDRASQDRASQDRASQDRASQDRASQDRASQDRASQDRASQDRASQDRASQD
jgi:hypothetical protein